MKSIVTVTCIGKPLMKRAWCVVGREGTGFRHLAEGCINKTPPLSEGFTEAILRVLYNTANKCDCPIMVKTHDSEPIQIGFSATVKLDKPNLQNVVKLTNPGSRSPHRNIVDRRQELLPALPALSYVGRCLSSFAGRTGTRVSSGCVHKRWHDGIEYAKQLHESPAPFLSIIGLQRLLDAG
jgi:hypothetical protein